jgi:hypothetical protein
VSSGSGIFVNAPGAVVKLRGLSINGIGGDRGIWVLAVAMLYLERIQIANMAQYGMFASNNMQGVFIRDMTVADTIAQSGVVVFDAQTVDIERLAVARSGAAALYLSDVGEASVRDSALIDSGRSGSLNTAFQIFTPGAIPTRASIQRVTVIGAATSCLNIQAQNAGSVITADVSASVFASCANANATFSGVRGFGSSSGIVHMAITDSVVRNCAGDAVELVGTGSTLTLSHATVVDNVGFGLLRTSGTFYTRGDNTVRGNNAQETTSQTSGTITSLSPI